MPYGSISFFACFPFVIGYFREAPLKIPRGRDGGVETSMSGKGKSKLARQKQKRLKTHELVGKKNQNYHETCNGTGKEPESYAV